MKRNSRSNNSYEKRLVFISLIIAIGLVVSCPVFCEDFPERKIVAGPGERYHVDLPISNGRGSAVDGNLSAIGSINYEKDSSNNTSSGIYITVSEGAQICFNVQNGQPGPHYIQSCDDRYYSIKIDIAPEFCSEDCSSSLTGGIGGGYGLVNGSINGGDSSNGSTGLELPPWVIDYMRKHEIITEIRVRVTPGVNPTINQLLDYEASYPFNGKTLREVLKDQNELIAIWVKYYHAWVDEARIPEPDYLDRFLSDLEKRIKAIKEPRIELIALPFGRFHPN